MIRNAAAALLMIGCLGCASATEKSSQNLESCMRNEIYAKAVDAYEKGLSALGKKDIRGALTLFDRGLEIIGDDYLYNELIDDTGMNLVLAKSEEKKGFIEVAANIKSRVLDSRLEALRVKHNCNNKKAARE